MVLRKKNTHVSFLHVYHHAGMSALAWGAAKYYPGINLLNVDSRSLSKKFLDNHQKMFIYKN